MARTLPIGLDTTAWGGGRALRRSRANRHEEHPEVTELHRRVKEQRQTLTSFEADTPALSLRRPRH